MYMLYDNKGKIRLPNLNLGLYVVQNFFDWDCSNTSEPESSTASGIWKDDHPSRTHLVWSWSRTRRSSAPALSRLQPPSPSRPMGSTCTTTRANTGDMAGGPRSPVDKPAFSYGQVLHWSLWSFRIQTFAPIWCRTILRRLLRFHEWLLPRGGAFFTRTDNTLHDIQNTQAEHGWLLEEQQKWNQDHATAVSWDKIQQQWTTTSQPWCGTETSGKTDINIHLGGVPPQFIK